MHLLNFILLQAATPKGSGMMNMVMILLIIIIFYFFMIRPQMKKSKTERQFRETIKKGDKIVTIGGIHGRVLDIENTTMMVEIDTNVRVRIEKTAVSVEATRQFTAVKKENQK